MSRILLFSIFMVFSISCGTAPQKFKAQIPKNDESLKDNINPNTEFKDAAIITLQSDGLVFYKKEQIGNIADDVSLDKELKKIFEEKNKSKVQSEIPIFVRAGKDVKYGYISNLTDKLKAIGFSQIGLQIDGLEN